MKYIYKNKLAKTFKSKQKKYNYFIKKKIIQIWNLRMQKNLNTEKIAIKVVQMKSLAMHITYQQWRFYMFMLRNVQNILMEHDLYLMS